MSLRLPAPLAAVIAVLHNRSLRLVLLAYIGFNIAEWGSWIAILVFAYGRGGAAETGVAALIQLVPSAFVAPLAAALGDRVRRDRALLVAYVVQASAMALTAFTLLVQAPPVVVYLCAAAAASSITLTRPIQAAIIPSLARAPSELTAANVSGGAVETISILVGPILAGAMLAFTGPAMVFVGSALVLVAGAILVSGIRAHDHVPSAGELGAGRWRALARESASGFGILFGQSQPRAVLGLLGAAAVLWGVLDVLLVVLALDLLLIGESGVGYLNAALGAGGLLGAALSVLLIGRARLAAPFAVGLGLWALPILLVGLLPGLAPAVLLIAAAGLGRIVMDVAGRTLLQRVVADHSLSRVFGVLEGMHMASLALGSILAPALIFLFGPHQAFVAAGGLVLGVLVLLWRPLRRVDSVGLARPRELELLRAQPIFAPLGPLELEQLAASLVPVHAHPGGHVIHQGDRGDHFFIVLGGRLEVDVDGRKVRELGAGDSFGEIALLRNVPRTASVRALERSELLSLGREAFLQAVTGLPASRQAAESVVRDRLGFHEEEADASA